MSSARWAPVQVLVGIAVLLLGGCGVISGARQEPDHRLDEEPPEAKVNGAAAANWAPTPPRTEPPAVADEAGDDEAQSPPIQLTAPIPPPQPPKPAPPPDPSKLLGMSPPQVVASLGVPVSQRDEPPAHVWRYATESCALEVFFFLDLASDSRRVLVYDFQTVDGLPGDGRACYREIEQRHAAARESIDLR